MVIFLQPEQNISKQRFPNKKEITMKKILLMLLFLPVAGHAQLSMFPADVMEKVYSSIYNHIKLFYPHTEFEVSYYMEDDCTPIYFSSHNMFGKRKRKTTYNNIHVLSADQKGDQFSETLYKLFATKNTCIKNPEYELWFSYPEYDLIACSLYPYGERESMWGTVIIFAFGFTPEGNIDFITHSIAERN